MQKQLGDLDASSATVNHVIQLSLTVSSSSLDLALLISLNHLGPHVIEVIVPESSVELCRLKLSDLEVVTRDQRRQILG